MSARNFIGHRFITREGRKGGLPSGIEPAHIGTHIRFDAPDAHEGNGIFLRRVSGIFPILIVHNFHEAFRPFGHRAAIPFFPNTHNFGHMLLDHPFRRPTQFQDEGGSSFRLG